VENREEDNLLLLIGSAFIYVLMVWIENMLFSTVIHHQTYLEYPP